jgi:hypothetical protein
MPRQHFTTDKEQRDMNIETRVAGAFNPSPGPANSARAAGRSGVRRPGDADTAGASVVIGLTAIFAVALFGLVTDFIPSLLVLSLVSLFVGISSGLISFTLMKN